MWAPAIALTGGFVVGLAGVRISSRSISNPILLALLSAGGALWLSSNYGRDLMDDLRSWWSAARSAYRLAAESRWCRWADLATLAAIGGAALQIYQWARARPLWLDEEMIALNIRDRSLPELMGALWLDQSAPLGWLAAQRAAFLAFGLSEAAVRLVPLLFAVPTLAVARWIGLRWMTPLGAGALVTLCALGQWVSHYSLELKHYSADMLFGLLLPALVAWTIEAEGPRHRLRRAAIWWTAAALGLWWSNGAALVSAGSALVLLIALWRVDGRRNAVAFAMFGLGGLVSLGLHHQLGLRHTLASGYLREYWSVGMPPPSAGVAESVVWVFGQAVPFAVKPGGTELTTLFWATVLAGVLLARPRTLAAALAAAPFFACVFAAIRLVPLYERLSLWVMPALYMAVALCIDAGVRQTRDAIARGQRARAALSVIPLAAGLWLCLDIGERGWRDAVHARPRDSNHLTDDRSGVRWLLERRRPDDALLTTRLSLPAVWWYGGFSVSPIPGAAPADGHPILEAFYRPPGPECEHDALRRALVPYGRVLVYFGFRFDDVPDGFDQLLLRDLGRIGRMTEFQRFAGVTGAAIVELTPGSQSPAADRLPNGVPPSDGCVSLRPAVRW